MDQLYYESGYIVEGYYTYVADAESAQTITTAIACDASIIAGGEIVDGTGSWLNDSAVTANSNLVAGGAVAMNSAFEQSVMISHIEGADLFAMSNAALAAEVSRIRDNNTAATAVFSIATDASRTRNYSSDDSAAFVIVADNLRVRYQEAALDAAFSMDATGNKTHQLSGALSATTSISATVTKQLGSAVTLTAAFTQVISASQTAQTSASLNSQFTQITDGYNVYKRPRQLAVPSTATFDTNSVVGTHSIHKAIGDNLWYERSNEYRIVAGEDFVFEAFFKISNYTTGPNYAIIGNNAWSVSVDTLLVNFTYATGSSGTSTTVSSTSLTYSPTNWTYVGVYKTGNTLYIKTSQNPLGTWTTPVTTTRDVTALNTNGTYDNGFIYTKNLVFGEDSSYVIGSVSESNIYLDEVYFARGTNQLQQFATAGVPNRINLGADSTTQFLFHFDNSFEDDIHGISNAQAALTATSSLSTTVDGNIKSAQATLQCQGFETVVIGRIAPGTAGLDARFTMAATGAKIKFGQAQLQSSTTLTATALDLDLASAALSSQFAISVTADRIKGAALAVSSNAILQATATKIASDWGNDEWFRGTGGLNTAQEYTRVSKVVTSGASIFELGTYDSDLTATNNNEFFIRSRELTKGYTNWTKSITIPTGTNSPFIHGQYYNNVLYILQGYRVTSSNTWYNTLMAVDPTTGSVTSSVSLYVGDIKSFTIQNDYVYITATNGLNGFIGKFSLATGTKIWSKYYSVTTGRVAVSHRVLVNDTDVYWLNANTYLNVGNFKLTKLDDSTGAAIWTLDTGIDAGLNADFNIDDQSNIYLVGRTANNSTSGVIAKIDSSGTTVWSRRVSAYMNEGIDEPDYMGWNAVGRLKLDADYNVYYITQDADGFWGYSDKIISLSSTGNIRWSRSFDFSTPPTTYEVNAADLEIKDDRLIFVGYAQYPITLNVNKDTGGNTVTAKTLPSPYPAGTWSYIDAGLTVSTVSYTTTSSSLTISNYSSSGNYAGFTTSTVSLSDFTYLYAVNGIGSWNSQTTQSTTVKRIRQFNSQLSVSTTVVAQPIKLVQLQSTINSTSTLSVTVLRKRPGTITAQSQFSQTFTAVKTTVTGSTLAVDTALTADNGRVRFADSAASITTSMTITAVKTTRTSGDFIAFVTELSIVNRIGQGLIHMDSTATVAASPVLLTGSQSIQTVETAVTVSAVSTNEASADITASSTVACAPTYLRHTEVDMTSSIQLVANNTRTRDFNSDITSSATLDVTPLVIRSTAANLNSTVTVIANNQIVRLAQANLQAATGITVYAGIMVRFEADLQCQGFVLSAGQVLHIDPGRQLLIDSETRALKIHEETRLLTVESETRVNII